MSSSALAAGLRHIRGKLAAQQHNDDSDEQLLHAFVANGADNAAALDELRLMLLIRKLILTLVALPLPSLGRSCRTSLPRLQLLLDCPARRNLRTYRSRPSCATRCLLLLLLFGLAARTAGNIEAISSSPGQFV